MSKKLWPLLLVALLVNFCLFSTISAEAVNQNNQTKESNQSNPDNKNENNESSQSRDALFSNNDIKANKTDQTDKTDIETNKGVFTFPTWIIEQTDYYVDNLKKQSASLTPQDISRSEQLAKEAKQKQQWGSLVAEYNRIMGKDFNNRKGWLTLAIANQNLKKAEKNYRAQDESKYAAIQAYRLSKTNDEKVEALLVLGNSIDPAALYETPSYQEVYSAIKSMVDLQKFRQSNPEFADFMTFQFTKMDVNTENTPPNVCFSFSQPLAEKGINYQDYIEVTPKIDGSLKVTGRQICLSPLQFGSNYDVIVKPGFPNELGEKIKNETKLSLKVKDQSSRLSFSPKAYVLMRNENPMIPLSGVNVDTVKIKVIRINDRNLNQMVGNGDYFLQSLSKYSIEQLQNSLGELIFEGTFSLGGEKNKTTTKQIPFAEIDKKGKPKDDNKKENNKNYKLGLYVVYAEEAFAVMHDKAEATQWVVMSDMGLTSYSESEGGIAVNIRSLKTADALKDVELQLIAYNNTILAKVKTDDNGNGYFEPSVTIGKGGNRPLWILAYGPSGDFSFIDLKQPGFDLSDRGASGRNTLLPLEAFIYSEQGVYRPGDTVHFDTLLRDNKANAVPKLPLTFIVQRPDEVEVARFVKTGTDLGFYEQEYPLATSSHTGLWSILAYADLKKEPIGRLHFSVEDFVPSRIMVQLKSDQKILTLKEPLIVDIKGQYLFGAKASGLTGMGTLTLKVNNNPFPTFPGYQFGLANEQFIDNRSQWMFQPLDNEGQSKMIISLDNVPKTSKVLEAVIKVTLADKGGRPEIGVLKMPVAVRPYNIGIKPTFGNVLSDSAEQAIFDVIAIDAEGNYLAIHDLEYELYEERVHYTWYQPSQYQPWQYQAQVEDNFLTKGVLSTEADRAQPLKLSIKDWGQYRIEIRDPKTGTASSVRFSKGWMEISKGEESPDRLKVKLDKTPVKIGDSISLYIEAPFEGQATVAIANDKIVETKNVKLSLRGTTVKFTAKENWGMGVYALISAVRPLEEKDDSFFFKKKPNEKAKFLPKRAIGLAWIALDTAPRLLDIRLETNAEELPGKTIKIPIEVKNKDKGNAPDKALVTLAAVDEGILKLTDFATPSPENFFFGQRQLGLVIRDYYGKLIEPLPGPIAELRQGGDAGILSRNMQALSKRSFKIVSLYKGVIPLDKGKGEVTIDLPEFNGTLRLMAVAFDENRVGSQSASLLVRGPIVLEGTLPRFLAPLDESFLTLSLFNLSAPEGEYQLSFKSEGSVEVKEQPHQENQPEAQNQTVHLKKDENKTVMIPIRAIKQGDGKITVSLQGQDLAFSQTFELSVRYPYPFTQKTDYQLIKEGARKEIPKELVQGYIPDTTQALLYVSSKLPWNSQAIYRSLSHYPYNCIEQMVSRAYASLLYAGENNEENKSKNESRDKSVVNQTLSLLSEKQKANGSFALWYEGEGEGWLSAYVLDFMLRAEEKGYQIPKFSLERGLDWLTRLLESRKEDDAGLIDASYAIYVLTKASRIESGTVRYFYDSFFEKLKSPSARAMIASALIEKGDLERAQAAFSQIYGQSNQSMDNIQLVAPYATNLSEKATVLTLLFEAQTKAPSLNLGDLIQSLEQSMVQDLKRSPSLSTQDQAWILLASHAFNDSINGENQEKQQSNITVNVDQQTFNASNGFLSLPIPIDQMTKGFTVENRSEIPLWQSVSVTGIEQLKMADSEGIDIDKHYYNLSGKEVSVESVKQGEQFVVVLTGKALTQYPYQLLVNDLLPAGFEIENARISQGNDIGLSWLGELTKPAFTELKDDRYLAFVYLDETNREFKLAYLVRAVTPGNYVLPGLSVEDMYVPQYFARTETGAIKITAP